MRKSDLPHAHEPRKTHPRWPLVLAGIVVSAWILLALVVAAALEAWK